MPQCAINVKSKENRNAEDFRQGNGPVSLVCWKTILKTMEKASAFCVRQSENVSLEFLQRRIMTREPWIPPIYVGYPSLYSLSLMLWCLNSITDLSYG